MQTFDPQPVTLTGTHVRLEPLAMGHAPALLEAAADEEIWRYLPVGPPQSLQAMEALIGEALDAAATGTVVPFAVIGRSSGRAVGSTRYLDIQRPHRGLEIGWTWYGRPWQRTAVNTECKYLLLEHAFEAHGAIRVQLKTDARNVRSQSAIERIGARREGVLRQQMIVQQEHRRDSVYYSIIDKEWPAVKALLQRKLARTG